MRSVFRKDFNGAFGFHRQVFLRIKYICPLVWGRAIVEEQPLPLDNVLRNSGLGTHFIVIIIATAAAAQKWAAGGGVAGGTRLPIHH